MKVLKTVFFAKKQNKSHMSIPPLYKGLNENNMVNNFSIKKTSMAVIIGVALGNTMSFSAYAESFLVDSQETYKNTLNNLSPGDEVILKNGIWNDFEITFTGKGTKDKPIKLSAQTQGKVILSGQSNLKLSGEYLEVSGLVFKDGYSPTGEVVSFRTNKEELAYHSRVSEIVIDRFNNPFKFENDSWVLMYGQYNRFDHNHLSGKSNKGVTMAVRLNTEQSRENHHRIDHNYFGPRPILGSNGGETLRIGTSHYSLSDSFTVVENNYFDRCDGEVEIISNKSGSNEIRNNTFFESRGTLTLRHGNGNIVENNVFFGNGVDHTGGIRVINADQVIRNNYLEGITGYRFGSGLTVMNGVPNSTINRYHQVNNALIENNTLVNVDNVHFAAGSDSERSAAPINSKMQNNLISHSKLDNTITIFDDISGINFDGNILSKNQEKKIKQGFESKSFKLKRAKNGLLYPTNKKLANKGVSKNLVVTQKADVGVAWYPKEGPKVAFASGDVLNTNAANFYAQLEKAQNGDTLLLADGGYDLRKIITLDKMVTLKAKNQGKAQLNIYRGTSFEIVDNGSLQLDGLTISGKNAPDSSGNVFIRTSRLPMLVNYRFELLNSEIKDLDINHSFNFFEVAMHSFADYIKVENNKFNNITGDLFKLNKEVDDQGIYNSEYVTFNNNEFSNVQGAVIKLYRGGTDESTFGPHIFMDGNTIDNVGLGKRNKEKASILVHGAQVITINNNTIKNSEKVILNHTVGEAKTVVENNTFINLDEVFITEINFPEKPTGIIRNNTYKKM